MHDKIINREKGVGLLEVLVSMLVIGIGLLGLAPMLVVSIEGNEVAENNTNVSSLLKERVEHFEGLAVMPAMPYSAVDTSQNGIYTRTTSIRDNTSDTLVPPGLYKIDITVNWTEETSLQRSASYSTFLIK